MEEAQMVVTALRDLCRAAKMEGDGEEDRAKELLKSAIHYAVVDDLERVASTIKRVNGGVGLVLTTKGDRKDDTMTKAVKDVVRFLTERIRQEDREWRYEE
jgi:hypothetical protein